MKCPVCMLQDQTQKVSAIVSSGTTTSNSTGHAVTLGAAANGRVGVAGTSLSATATTSSVLAQKLAKPEYIEAKVGWLYPTVVFIIVFFLNDFILDLISPGKERGFFSSMLHGLIPLVLALVAAVGFSDDRQKKISEKSSPEREMYERAGEIWYDLDYCHRCDVVFSSKGQYVRSDQINELLFYHVSS